LEATLKIEVKKENTFIPEWNGNRDESESEQIKVVYRYPTVAEKERFLYTKPIKVSEGGASEIEFVQDSQGLAKAIIKRVENLSLEVDGKEKQIKTAGDLYSIEGVPSALVREIEMHLVNASPEVDADFLA
jgi:hypothetical protein